MSYYTRYDGELMASKEFTSEQVEELNKIGKNGDDSIVKHGFQWTIHEWGIEFYHASKLSSVAVIRDLQGFILRYVESLGIQLNGEVMCNGEESTDVWKINVTDNTVKVLRPTFS